MAGSNFKAVLHEAGLTPEQFAEIVDVDPKTVRRWNNGRLPYPRHRAKIARALDTTEQHLWPDTTPEQPDADPDDSESPVTADGAVVLPTDAAGIICEVAASWGSPRDPGAPNVPRFLADARQIVEVLPGGSGLLKSPGLGEAVKRCADAGASVRLLVDTLPLALSELVVTPGVEVRVVDQRFMHAVIRGDDRLLLGLWLAGDGPVPLLQLQRRADGGVFDQLARHFDAIWKTAHPHPAPAGAAEPRAPAARAERGSGRRWPGRRA